MGGDIGGPAFSPFGALGQAIPFYAFFANQSGNEFFEGEFSSFNTLWRLDFAPGTGASLSYTVIPIPGAVWLLGSAMAGLIGVARRRT